MFKIGDVIIAAELEMAKIGKNRPDSRKYAKFPGNLFALALTLRRVYISARCSSLQVRAIWGSLWT